MSLKCNATQNVMSHLKWNVTQNEIPLKMECHSKWNVTLKWTVTQNRMSLKIKCHLKWIVTQYGISFKMECN